MGGEAQVEGRPQGGWSAASPQPLPRVNTVAWNPSLLLLPAPHLGLHPSR